MYEIDAGTLFFISKTQEEEFMKKGLKKVIALFLSMTCVMSLAACSSGDSTSNATKTYKSVINIAANQEAPSLDLMKNTTAIGRYICSGAVFEKLVTLNANSEPVPELAESINASADSSSYVFNLRKGVKFHDGTEMKAADVVASMNRWINGYSSAKTLVGTSRFEVVDDYTVKIAFTVPCVTFLSVIASSSQVAIITTAAACTNEDSNGYLTNYIGTGPYKFKEWKLNDVITLEKFNEYVPYGDANASTDGWAGYKNAYATTINFYYVPDEATRVAGLQTGQYDCAFGLSSDTYDSVNNNSDLSTFAEQGGTNVLVFNKKQGLGANQLFRQAVNTGIKYTDLNTVMAGKFFELGSCYMDNTQSYWVTDAGKANYNINDITKAKALLAQSGYNGETFRILTSNISNFDKLAEVLRQELVAMGINVTVTTVDWATFTSYRTDPTGYDLYLTSFASVSVPSQKVYFGSTYPGWTNDAQLTDYLNQFNSATTLEQAKAVWVKTQEYCWQTLPIINLGHYTASYGYSKKLEGSVNYQGMYFWNARVAE